MKPAIQISQIRFDKNRDVALREIAGQGREGADECLFLNHASMVVFLSFSVTPKHP